MPLSPGAAAFRLAFAVSPIILAGGVAGAIPGGMLPLISVTEAANFVAGLLSGGDNIGLEDFFAYYEPIPGGTIIDQQIGHYPFANQAVAANAVIAQPLKISMLMICPVKSPGTYATKLATMMALQATLQQHNASGGTYTIVTPSAFYANCVMLAMTDVSNSASHQAQNQWRLDFEQPLLTVAQAQQQQNAQMAKMTSGTATDGTTSGLGQTVGAPFTIAAPSVVPAASGAPSAGTATAPGTATGTPSGS